MKQNILQFVMVVCLIAGAYLIGVYKTKVEFLEKGLGTGQQAAAPTEQQPTEPPVVDQGKLETLIADNNNLVFGNKNAKIKFVEFSDPSCPYCHIAAGKNPSLNKQVDPRFQLSTDGGSYVAPVPEMKRLVDEGKAVMVWLYAPGHGNGELGTIAMYCANEKGKFWETHDKLMTTEGYDLLNEEVQNSKANAGKLADFLAGQVDKTFLKSCLESGKYDGRVDSDPQIMADFGYVPPNFGGTPTFFVNETGVVGASSWTDSFEPVVKPLL